MSTPPSKTRLTLGALGVALGTYLVLAFGLGRLAAWAEASFEAYSYQGGEESLRWLMPSTFHPAPSLLIVGPSAIGESLRYEELARATGRRVVSAALSNGTLDDVTLALKYVERVHGTDALPQHVVLGMTPRVLANYPRNFGPSREDDPYSFFIPAINNYSPYYSVRAEQLGSALRPKSATERWSAYRNWATKQQPRYRTGVMAALEYLLDPESVKVGFQDGLPDFTDLRTPLDKDNWRTTMEYAKRVGLAEALRHWLPAYRSAYFNSFMTPLSEAKIAQQVAGWDSVYAWDPMADEELVRLQLGSLRDLLDRNNIRLTVIHLPEHPMSRAQYDPAHYRGYRELIAEELPDADIIDMWEQPGDRFFDQVHLTYAGAEWMTDQLIPVLGGNLGGVR